LKKQKLYVIISIVAKIMEYAGVAELADALDLGSSGKRRGGSSPFSRTSNIHNGIDFLALMDAGYLVEFFYIF
jgi:hypothetical protein